MDLDQQESQLNNLDTRDISYKITEPVYANTIAFNGVIISTPIDVGGGFVAFEILAGKEKAEMPLILVKNSIEEVNKYLRKEDRIAGVGFLKKVQEQFVIETIRIDRIPTQEEIDNLQ